MSPPVQGPQKDGPRAAQEKFETRVLLLLIWAAAVLSSCVAYGFFSLSPDDAMRLVEVRDFLAGQNWFDLAQYRLDPPHGVMMHWSRLVDLPLAALITAGKTVLPAALAERVAMTVWPLALLLVFLVGILQLARNLGGETAARIALLFAVLMAPALQYFRPGSIHHHNVQLTLIIWALAFFVRTPTRARDGAIAGLLCALSVAVGVEMVPMIAALATVAGLRWVVEGNRVARATIGYAVALAAGTIVFGVATVAPANYLVVHCDAISVAQVGVLSLGGFGLAALAALPSMSSVIRRLAAAGGLAILIGAFLKIGAPQCLGNPYGQLDPRLVELWLSSVSEATSLLWIMHHQPQHLPAYFGLPLAAIVVGAIQSWRDASERRWNWIACTAVQAALFSVSAWEVRGAGSANVVAAALFSAALLQLLPTPEGPRRLFNIGRPALAVMLLFNPASLLALGNVTARAFATPATTRLLVSGQAGTCQRPADYTPLASLPRGRVLAFIDSGPFILMQTHDAVFAGPYHRNQAGNIAMFDMFLSPPAKAQKLMAKYDVAYVAFCPGAPERYTYAEHAPHGLAAVLGKNDVPTFLQRVRLAGTDLAVYRVRR
jgi:hypothetical protein